MKFEINKAMGNITSPRRKGEVGDSANTPLVEHNAVQYNIFFSVMFGRTVVGRKPK